MKAYEPALTMIHRHICALETIHDTTYSTLDSVLPEAFHCMLLSTFQIAHFQPLTIRSQVHCQEVLLSAEYLRGGL